MCKVSTSSHWVRMITAEAIFLVAFLTIGLSSEQDCQRGKFIQ